MALPKTTAAPKRLSSLKRTGKPLENSLSSFEKSSAFMADWLKVIWCIVPPLTYLLHFLERDPRGRQAVFQGTRCYEIASRWGTCPQSHLIYILLLCPTKFWITKGPASQDGNRVGERQQSQSVTRLKLLKEGGFVAIIGTSAWAW